MVGGTCFIYKKYPKGFNDGPQPFFLDKCGDGVCDHFIRLWVECS